MLFIAAFLASTWTPLGVSESDVPYSRPSLQSSILDFDAMATEAPIEMREPTAPGWLAADAWRKDSEAHQVRIRQEIMIRVSPRRPNTREMVADWRQVLPRRYDQRKIGKCLPARSIVAVQTVSPRDLVLYLSDNRMIRAQLRKSCNARDFYLGFYVEPTDDGELCVGRDILRARNGATCKIGAIRQLVPAE
ncbi:hypothetical protein DL238_14120 [Alteriqipengyuania lutimaris]|uniref:Uncharacterized protein n=2 Tax=Alteriqipengyuania lutimaris TaxID=1538146 RepID=A0A395LG70_9SPHN|nr:hypothetical protein DL238_14120 [Alteriqipengyuania lutimaris]